MQSRRVLLAYGVFIVWILACVYGYWWFSLRHIQQYSTQAVAFNGKDLQELELSYDVFNDQQHQAVAYVVHFIDDDCPCSRFSRPHINGLEHKYDHSVKFLEWSSLPIEIREKLSVPASPAVAIWDREGQLNYFGPYSGGNYCGQGDDFVSSRLNQLKANERRASWINHDVLGCYCPWTKTKVTKE